VRDLQTFIKDIYMLFKKSALVLAASILTISSAQAGSVVSSLAVSISASAFDPNTNCTVTIPAFTNPGYISGTLTSSSVLISPTVACGGTNPIPFTVHAGPGGNSAGGTRKAVSGGNSINYNLKNGGGTSTVEFDQSPNPNFAGGTPITGTTSGAGNNAVFTFRLVVPAGQTVAAGTYTDTVVLTTTF
jgi:spore coat protein U-like protein